MKLQFNTLSQQLELISICEKSEIVKFTYKDETIYGSDVSMPCRRLFEIFPPMKLGEFLSADMSYRVKPSSGTTLVFEFPSQEAFTNRCNRSEHPVDDPASSPILTSIEVSLLVDETMHRTCLTRYDVILSEGLRVYLPGSVDFEWIGLGISIQELVSVLGPPEEIYGDVLNYYRHGLDVRTDNTAFGSVRKLILRTNQPDTPLFGRYRRAWFNLIQRKTSKTTEAIGDNTSDLAALSKHLGDPGSPLVVNSSNLLSSKCFYSFCPGMTVEFSNGGMISTVEITGA
jgi:hypothetical protein